MRMTRSQEYEFTRCGGRFWSSWFGANVDASLRRCGCKSWKPTSMFGSPLSSPARPPLPRNASQFDPIILYIERERDSVCLQP